MKTGWWNIWWVDMLIKIIIVIVMIIMFSLPIAIWKYTQRYIQDDNTTATKGLIFTSSINLAQHKKIGSGNGLYGQYDMYTRSDRQREVIDVYTKGK